MPLNPATTSLLIVAPSSPERSQIRALAERLQFKHIHVAEDAISGFGVLALERPDVTLADHLMRPTDAFTFVREVRNTPIENRDAPIYIFTRGDPNDLSIAAQGVGADGVFGLPLDEAALLATIEQAAPAAPEGQDRRVNHAPYAGQERRGAEGRAAVLRAKQSIARLLVEAEAGLAAWTRSGFDPKLVAVETALDAAAQLAVRAGDAAVLRALTASLAVVDESRRSWDGDDRKIRAAIEEVRALLDLPQASAISKL